LPSSRCRTRRTRIYPYASALSRRIDPRCRPQALGIRSRAAQFHRC
jgi:hypothetical protein